MADLIFVGQFVASKIGKTGLTVTVDVDRFTISDGTRTALVTAGSATEVRRGLYHYRLASADLSLYQYVATFITADSSVDQQEIAALGLVVPDALVGSRLATAGYIAPPSASDNATATVNAFNAADPPPAVNATHLDGDDAPIDNLVLALQHADGVVAHPQGIADALMLAPSAGSPAVGSVNKHLDDVLAYGGGSGTGTYTDTIEDPTGNPLDGVRVQLSTDAAGTHRVYEAFTNVLGVFVMNPDPGVYYRWVDLAGYTDRLTQGAQVTVT